MSNIIVLGIAGGSGSGKTTLMKNLIARFQDDVTVLSHDNYYRPYDELTIEERRKLNYDHPDAFDTDMMIGHLRSKRPTKSWNGLGKRLFQAPAAGGIGAQAILPRWKNTCRNPAAEERHRLRTTSPSSESSAGQKAKPSFM